MQVAQPGLGRRGLVPGRLLLGLRGRPLRGLAPLELAADPAPPQV